jgi:basic membrane protein A
MGYDLVIAHGFDLVPGVQQAAPQFPNTAFATSLPIKGNPSNVKVYLLNFEQFGFAGGFLACQGTKNKNIGLANGPKATFDAQTLYGFQQGADMFCPGTKVQNVYGDFADSAIMKEAVTQMASQGADSIFSGVSASQPGVLAGCQSANVACWANASYAPASAPTVVLGTVNYDYGYFAPEWIQELRAGQWKGGFQFIDLKSGAISLICTDLGESKFPGLKKKCDDFNQTAKSGGFDVKPMPTSS